MNCSCTSKESPKRPSKSKTIGGVKAITAKLMPNKRKMRKSSSKTNKDPHLNLPLHGVFKSLLIKWRKSCGFFMPDNIAENMVSSLLKLEKDKVSASMV